MELFAPRRLIHRTTEASCLIHIHSGERVTKYDTAIFPEKEVNTCYIDPQQLFQIVTSNWIFYGDCFLV